MTYVTVTKIDFVVNQEQPTQPVSKQGFGLVLAAAMTTGILLINKFRGSGWSIKRS